MRLLDHLCTGFLQAAHKNLELYTDLCLARSSSTLVDMNVLGIGIESLWFLVADIGKISRPNRGLKTRRHIKSKYRCRFNHKSSL